MAFPSFEPEPLPDPASRAFTALNAHLRREVRPTYWLTGGIIGGAGMGILGAVVGAGLCSEDDNNLSTGTCILSGIGGAALFGAVGFTVGALIGGQFPKSPPASTGS